MTFCLEEREYEILMARRPFDDCARYIESKFGNIVKLQPGEEILPGLRAIGYGKIPVAYGDEWIVLPITKPCHGSFVVKIEVSAEELEWFLKKHVSGR
ncbi:DUF1894 domain-containing protein [Methanopyrus kandleri]|uniref:Uncharacterized protein conserved in archaea n=2 Tax=Methanopyrus kandleri TaxID=2320 RepID=Q8TY94_METKA|nr:DUF1894 domain-containing protein [Methanopyrus kandleri]AAM01626.1 Uncharacterized protein conserved in archaea [Methanopyrus kandleri AV19]HII70430.1 DUF1894 domain-containing protein [Methanopyrus kandleri]